MISKANIIGWQSTTAPWPNEHLVEHDLILSRAICELYKNKHIQENLIFRGGTALHKLFFSHAGRFSEDLDFVQKSAGPIGDTVHAIRDCLDHWLGEPSWKQNQGRFTLNYKFETEIPPIVKRKVKIEINTREHFSISPLIEKPFAMKNSWYSGSSLVLTYSLEELLGTKLRALYQRKKGRDLYDLWFVDNYTEQHVDYAKIRKIFLKYMEYSNQKITYSEFKQNIIKKQNDNSFNNDILPLLAAKYRESYDIQQAYQIILNNIVPELP